MEQKRGKQSAAIHCHACELQWNMTSRKKRYHFVPKARIMELKMV